MLALHCCLQRAHNPKGCLGSGVHVRWCVAADPLPAPSHFVNFPSSRRVQLATIALCCCFGRPAAKVTALEERVKGLERDLVRLFAGCMPHRHRHTHTHFALSVLF